MHLISLPFEADASVYFERIRHLPWPLLLDSNQPRSHFGRYDIMMAAPSCVIKFQNNRCQIDKGQGFQVSGQDPFTHIAEQLATFNLPELDTPELPFYGGAAGLFGYDYGRQLETMPKLACHDIAMADIHVGIYPWAIITDHQAQTTTFICHLDEQHTHSLHEQIIQPGKKSDTAFQLSREFSSNMSAEEYQQKFNQVIDYIEAGDCYQVCLAQRFDSEYMGHPWDAFLQLRQQAPTPFSAYMETADGCVISLSPERFLQVSNKLVETKPIKGTRPRGSDTAQDQALKDELYNSPKDRAENLMIVDLLRNDLSKRCLPGSVQVPKLFDIESYSNVHHMVTTVTGELADTDDILPLLQGAFPGGSITGAPKIRAMEIIEELEPHRRNAYTGSIGYLSCHGNMDTNILIRTLVTSGNDANGGQVYCWAGGGLVADSNGAEEYQETFDKVNNLLQGLQRQA